LSKLPQEAVNGLIAGLQSDRPQTLTNMFKGFFHTQPSQGIENWLWHMGMKANVHATIETVKAIGREDLRSDLEAIRVPTLMLHGVHDQVCPFPAAEQAHQPVSTSTLVRFEKADTLLSMKRKKSSIAKSSISCFRKKLSFEVKETHLKFLLTYTGSPASAERVFFMRFPDTASVS